MTSAFISLFFSCETLSASVMYILACFPQLSNVSRLKERGMIHVYEISKLDAAQRARLLRRAEIEIDDLIEYVRPIVRAVRERGDEALIEFMARFDHVQLTPDRLRVSRDEIERAYAVLD